jgi:hypothetical protein
MGAARRVLSLSARRAATVLVVLVAAAVAATGAASAPRLEAPNAAEIAYASGIADATTIAGPGALRRASWGGPRTTSTGEIVNVFISDTYPVDEARAQAWADYLASLVHGPELATVSLYLAPLDEVGANCGRGALACYSPVQHSIVAPGDDPSPELSAEAVVAHEYGHHVAASQINPPWDALDWGTKRWATYMDVCSRTEAGELYPGDEREQYRLNPGEAFAEAYRVLNQTRLGTPVSPWTIVDPVLEPDQTALDLLALDVQQPWTAATVASSTGRVTAKAVRGRTQQIATPLDGRLRVSVRVPAKSRYTIELIDKRTGSRVARSTAPATRVATVETTVCGQRSYTARVTAVKGGGAYSLKITRP